jgi:hypothetical protein
MTGSQSQRGVPSCAYPLIERRVVMFSSGAGSWAAAQRAAQEHGTDDLWLVFSDVSMEDEDNYRFLIEAAADVYGITLPKWWFHPWRGREHTRAERMRNSLSRWLPRVVWLKDGRDIWQVFKDDAFLGNTRLANCSKFLKQRPARAWLDANCDPATTVVYVGIDWSEQHRLPAVVRNYLPYRAEAPLCSPPYVEKADILAAVRARGIEPPRLYDLGFTHANCGGGCVRAGQGQFAHLLKVIPERFLWWEENEEDLRQHLGKDVAILRDRRGGKTVPLTLRSFRERHEAEPEQTDLFDIGGCGCFVDEGDAA